MAYSFKRALGMGLALYVSTFVVGIICGMISGQDMSTIENIPDSFWYIGMVGAVVLTALFSMWYFKNPGIVPSAKSGFLFGLTAVILSSALDAVLFSVGGQTEQLGVYFGDYRFWVIIALVVITATAYGHMKKPKTAM